MTFKTSPFALLPVLLILSACSVAPTFETVKPTLRPVAGDQSRIFVYQRLNPLTYIFQENFNLDGEDISQVFGGTSFMVNTTPGPHKIRYSKGTKTLDLNLKAGEAIYLKYSRISRADTGSQTLVEIVSQKFAEEEMAKTNFVEAKMRTFTDNPAPAN